MSDPHDNIFFWYGQDPDSPGGSTQHENNTTKALVHTLVYAELASRFVRELLGVDLGDHQTLLQADGTHPALVCRRWKRAILVGISPQGEDPGPGVSEGGARPDAWLLGEDVLIAIEVKTRGALEADQMARHEALLAQHAAKVERRVFGWRRDVAPFLQAAKPDTEPGKLLVTEFNHYLELTGMGPIRFSLADFMAFERQQSGDAERLQASKERLKALGEELLPLLPGHAVHAQNVAPDYVGINLHLSGKQPVFVPHLSVGISRLQLAVFLTVESVGPIRKLVRARHRSNEIERAVQQLGGPGWAVEVNEKWHFTPGGRGERQSSWFLDSRLPVESLRHRTGWIDGVWDRLEELTSEEHRQATIMPLEHYQQYGGRTVHGCLGVSNTVPWYKVDDLGTDVVGRVRGAVEQLQPVYRLVREMVGIET